MQNGDFELNGYLIGRGQPVFVGDFKPGNMTTREADVEDPQGDERWFGRDFLTPPIWSFEFNVSQPAGTAPAPGSLAALEDLAAAWRTAVDPHNPEVVATLRYMIGGRIRRVVGRPRNFTFDPSQNIEDGLITATAQFALRDTFAYADELSSTELTLNQPTTGFTTLPGVWPLLFERKSDRQGVFNIPSRATVYPEDITFYGPLTNPALKLDTNGWDIRYQGTIPESGWVRIDPRARTVLDHAGASRAGNIGRKTILTDLLLTPGQHGLLFTGTDPTSTGRAVVRWRPAYFAL